MDESLAEAAMNGFCVPGSRTELERMDDEIPGGLSWSSSYMRCDVSEV